MASVAGFYVKQPSDVPFSLQSKLDKPLDVFTVRRTADHLLSLGGYILVMSALKLFFGLPWTFEQFMTKAVERGHPANFCKLVPKDLSDAI